MTGDRAEGALLRVERLLRELIDGGLERVSSGTVEEIRELSRTVHQARLIRLERELAGLATVAERYLARDPSFGFGSWIAACSKAHLLGRAARRILAQPDADRTVLDAVLGVPRRTYEPVAGTVLVHALGASAWVADSGYIGITVHLWDARDERVLQATIARPTSLFGPDPSRLLFQPVSEVSMLTVHDLSHGAWRLDNVRVSSDGRLSLHSELHAVPGPPAGRRAYEAFAVPGAARILDLLSDREIGLIGSSEPTLALVHVTAVREVSIDETAARASAELVDRTGAVLRVSVPLRAHHDLLVDNLARLQRQPPVAVFGRVYLAGAAVGIEPWTALFDSPVPLAIRRRKEVQEVHLGLEPLEGEVSVPNRRRPAPPAASAEARELRQAADAVQQVIERLYGTGLAAVQPGLKAELEALAALWTGAGVPGAGTRLRAVARIVDRGDEEGAHAALIGLAEWLRLFRAGVALNEARAATTATEPVQVAPTGEDLVVRPVGAELHGARLAIHGLAPDGTHVVLEDELPGVDPLDPFAAPAPSRLFQDEIHLDDVLRRTIELSHHPVARGPGRWVVRPAFETAARSGSGQGADLPRVDRPSGRPFRVQARASRDPAGWTLEVPGSAPLPVDQARLQLDLEKRSADPDRLRFDLVGVARRDRVVVLAIDGTFPTLDPRATRWSIDRLRARAAGTPLEPMVEALVGGAATPDLPVVDADADTLEVLVTSLRGDVGRGGVLPSAVDLWALGRAWLRASGGTGPPIRALDLPRERLWLAAAAPVAAWLRGDPGVEARAVDALWLAIGAGICDVLVDG